MKTSTRNPHSSLRHRSLRPSLTTLPRPIFSCRCRTSSHVRSLICTCYMHMCMWMNARDSKRQRPLRGCDHSDERAKGAKREPEGARRGYRAGTARAQPRACLRVTGPSGALVVSKSLGGLLKADRAPLGSLEAMEAAAFIGRTLALPCSPAAASPAWLAASARGGSTSPRLSTGGSRLPLRRCRTGCVSGSTGTGGRCRRCPCPPRACRLVSPLFDPWAASSKRAYTCGSHTQ